MLTPLAAGRALGVVPLFVGPMEALWVIVPAVLAGLAILALVVAAIVLVVYAATRRRWKLLVGLLLGGLGVLDICLARV